MSRPLLRLMLSPVVVNMQLAGLAELADILGVTKHTAVRYAKRPGFPKPIAILAATPSGA